MGCKKALSQKNQLPLFHQPPLQSARTIQSPPFLGNSALYIGFFVTLSLKIGFFSEPP